MFRQLTNCIRRRGVPLGLAVVFAFMGALGALAAVTPTSWQFVNETTKTQITDGNWILNVSMVNTYDMTIDSVAQPYPSAPVPLDLNLPVATPNYRFVAIANSTSWASVFNCATDTSPGAFISSLTFPATGFTQIGKFAFYTSNNRTSPITGPLNIPAGVTTIESQAFYACSGFTGDLTIPGSVTSIGQAAFIFCSGFTGDLTISPGMTSIGGGAFLGCSGFNAVTIPDSVTTLGLYALADCSNLKSVTFAGRAPKAGENVYGGGEFGEWYDLSLNVMTYIIRAWLDDWNSNPDVTGGPIENGNAIWMLRPIRLPGFMMNFDVNGGTLEQTEQWQSYGNAAYILPTPTRPGWTFTGWFNSNGDKVAGTVQEGDAATFANVIAQWEVRSGWWFVNETTKTQITDGNWILNVSMANTYDMTIDSVAQPYPSAPVPLDLSLPVATPGYRFVAIASQTSFTTGVFRNMADADPGAFISSLTFPSTGLFTTIGNYAFYTPTSRTSPISGDLTIPTGVTTIGRNAFDGCSGFQGSLTIPDSVMTIGHSAFSYCNGFTGSLTIPVGVTSVQSHTFLGCSGFTGDLTIPGNVTTIGIHAFDGCFGFTGNLTIAGGVMTIGDNAFRNCFGFAGSLTIPDSVTAIGNYAFSGCSGFTGNLVIPDSVTSMGSYAFYGCFGFTGELTIPASVTIINGSTFADCSGLSAVTIPDSVTTLGNYALADCAKLLSVTFTGSYPSTTGQYVYGGDNWYDISPNVVTYITRAHLDNWNSNPDVTGGPIEDGNATWKLRPIRLPGFMMTFDVNGGTLEQTEQWQSYGNAAYALPTPTREGWTFAGWFNSNGEEVAGAVLESDAAKFAHVIARWTSGNGWWFVNETTKTQITDGNWILNVSMANTYDMTIDSVAQPYPSAPVPLDLSLPVATPGYHFLAIGPDGVFCNINATDPGAFISSLTFPATGFTTIGVNAFNAHNASGMLPGRTLITGPLMIPDSVTTIGNGAFAGCSGFTGSLTIPDSVTTIGNGAFAYCSGLTGDLTIPASVESISFAAFYECTGFTGLDILAGVKSIGTYAFFGCTGFTGHLTFPDSVQVIARRAFEGCSGFSGLLTIPGSVNAIGQAAFEGCSGFAGLNILPGVVFIEDYAFFGCSGLTDVTIPDSVTDIGNAAFLRCSGLTALTIPDSVTTLGSYALADCTRLLSVTFTGSYPATTGQYVYGGDSWYDLTPNVVTFITRAHLDNWNSNPDVTNGPIETSNAIWNLRPIRLPGFMMTFDANGGTLATTEQWQAYDAAYVLPTPTRPGWTFTGWFNSNGEQPTGTVRNDDAAKFANVIAHYTPDGLIIDEDARTITHPGLDGNLATTDDNLVIHYPEGVDPDSLIDSSGNVTVPEGGSVTNSDGLPLSDTVDIPAGSVIIPGGAIVVPGENETIAIDQNGVVTIPENGHVYIYEPPLKEITIPDGHTGTLDPSTPGQIDLTDDNGDDAGYIDIPSGVWVKPDGSIEHPGLDGDINSKDDNLIITPDGENKPVLDDHGNIIVPGDGCVTDGNGDPLVDKDGNVVDIPADTVITPGGAIVTPGTDGQQPSIDDNGVVTVPDGGHVYVNEPPVKELILPEGDTGTIDPKDPGKIDLTDDNGDDDGYIEIPSGLWIHPDGSITLPNKDGKLKTPDDITVTPGSDGSTPWHDNNGNVIVPEGGRVIIGTGDTTFDIDVPASAIVTPPGFIILPDAAGDPRAINDNGIIPIPKGGQVIIDIYPGEGTTITLPTDGYYEPSIPGIVLIPSHDVINPDGSSTVPGKDGDPKTGDDNITVHPGDDGQPVIPDENGYITVPEGGSVTDGNGDEITIPGTGDPLPPGTIITPDGTIILPGTDDNGDPLPPVIDDDGTIIIPPGSEVIDWPVTSDDDVIDLPGGGEWNPEDGLKIYGYIDTIAPAWHTGRNPQSIGHYTFAKPVPEDWQTLAVTIDIDGAQITGWLDADGNILIDGNDLNGLNGPHTATITVGNSTKTADILITGALLDLVDYLEAGWHEFTTIGTYIPDGDIIPDTVTVLVNGQPVDAFLWDNEDGTWDILLYDFNARPGLGIPLVVTVDDDTFVATIDILAPGANLVDTLHAGRDYEPLGLYLPYPGETNWANQPVTVDINGVLYRGLIIDNGNGTGSILLDGLLPASWIGLTGVPLTVTVDNHTPVTTTVNIIGAVIDMVDHLDLPAANPVIGHYTAPDGEAPGDVVITIDGIDYPGHIAPNGDIILDATLPDSLAGLDIPVTIRVGGDEASGVLDLLKDGYTFKHTLDAETPNQVIGYFRPAPGGAVTNTVTGKFNNAGPVSYHIAPDGTVFYAPAISAALVGSTVPLHLNAKSGSPSFPAASASVLINPKGTSGATGDDGQLLITSIVLEDNDVIITVTGCFDTDKHYAIHGHQELNRTLFVPRTPSYSGLRRDVDPDGLMTFRFPKPAEDVHFFHAVGQ